MPATDVLVHRAGFGSLLVELVGERITSAEVIAAADAIAFLPDTAETLPAAVTVLVTLRPGIQGSKAAAEIERTARDALTQHRAGEDASTLPADSSRTVEIPVVYNGEDLDEVARHLGVDRNEVIRRHRETSWRAAFGGFAPGFMYLTPASEAEAEAMPLTVPRRSTARTRVPARSVALGGGYGAVYPKASPGGWQLIGEAQTELWRTAADRPSTIMPGDIVRFVEASAERAAAFEEERRAEVGRAEAERAERGGGAVAGAPDEGAAALRVLSPGLFTTVQDEGRPGYASVGVAGSGWADEHSARLANRLVGNREDAAVLETVAGGLALEALRACAIAVTGAAHELRLTDALGRSRGLGSHTLIDLEPGDRLEVQPPERGLRTYIALEGGVIAGEPVLGTQSYDTLAQLGVPPLAAGALLAEGDARDEEPSISWAPPTLPDGIASGAVPVLDIMTGPREAWFTPEALAALTSQTYEVTGATDRVGVRIEAATPLERGREGLTPDGELRELQSEGVALGSLQVPPSGQPTLFLADHPVTGGYPVIAVLTRTAVARAAQLAPGERVRFRIARGS